MDPQQASRLITIYLQAVQAWERSQALLADAAALSEAALAARDRAEELHRQAAAVSGS